MRPVVAIDAHKDSCTYVVRHWNENLAGPTRIPTTESALRRLAVEYADHDFVVEVCNVHEWMIDLFRSLGVRAMAVIPPKKGPVGKKSDDDDATRLARKHQAGELVEVYIATPEVRALRDLVRQHEFLKRKRTAFNNNLKHALIRSGFQPGGTAGAGTVLGVYSDEGRAQIVARFPHLESVYAVIDVLDERMEALKRQIDARGKAIPEVRLLRSIPGVGPIVSLALYTEIAEVERFDRAEKLVRYFGLDPVHGSSGDTHWDGHRISKKGVSYLRGVLAQGAWSHVNNARESDITANFHRLVGRGKTKQQALMMVMRRLVKAVFWMLKEQREFTMTAPAR